MKLYTEEQVRQAYNTGYHDSTINHVNDCHNFIDALNYLSKYIELPSDEDIDIQSYLHNPFKKEDGHLLGASFICGAKWVIEQINRQDSLSKLPISEWETGVDEQGGYYIEPITNKKRRWKSNTTN